MSADAPAAQPVLLEYTLTADDLLDGFTAAHRVVRRPWYLRHLAPLVTVVVVLVVVGRAALAGDGTPALWIALAVTVAILLLLTAVIGRLVRRFADPAKLTYRWSSRQLVRGNPGLVQPLRVAVGADGVHIVAAGAETTARWVQHPYHVETPRSFVLLASDRLGAGVLVLPKRAMGETDAAGLRALLSAHTRRLG